MTTEKPAEKPKEKKKPEAPQVFKTLTDAVKAAGEDKRVYRVSKQGATFYAIAASPQGAMEAVMQNEGFGVELVTIKEKFRAAILAQQP